MLQVREGGEFYTPQPVSKLLIHLCERQIKKIKQNQNKESIFVYDPTCGSGSLLLNYNKYFKEKHSTLYYGEEINWTTWNLCRINMFLHDISYNDFDIAYNDTLTDSHFYSEQKQFDVIVSNPPYSTKWKGQEDVNIREDLRYKNPGTLAPRDKADFAFIQHSIYLLKQNGIAAIVCAPGIFYRSGAEKAIRKYFVDQNYIDAIIYLPDNLFYGTTISTCILVLRKNKGNDTNIKIIDATKQFIKEGKKNILNDENIKYILDLYYQENQENGKDIVNISMKDVINNEYNLSLKNYFKNDLEDQIDHYSIEELEKELEITVNKTNLLRNQIKEMIGKR